MDLLRSMAWRSCSPLIMGLALSGCAWLIDYGEANSLEAYAEAVFRRQNHATSEMMDLANEDGAILGYDTLLDAETAMRQACHALNDYASRMQSDQSGTLFQQGEVATSLRACDRATRRLEHLLDQVD